MRYTIRLSILLALVLATTPLRTESRGLDSQSSAPLAQSRLVVFETFMRPG